MAIGTHTKGSRDPGRRSHRLLFVLFGAILLVSLPVWPLKFFSDSFKTLNLKQIASISGELFKSFSSKESPSRKKEPTRPVEIEAAQDPKLESEDLKLLDKASGTLLAQISKSPNDPSLHNRLAIIYAGLGDLPSAINHFQIAVDVGRSQITALHAQEEKLRARGDINGASEALLESSKLSVELSAAHSSLARVFDQLGQHEKVLAQLEQLNKDINFGNTAPEKSTEPDPISAPRTAVQTDPPTEHRLNTGTLQLLARAQALMQAHRIPEAMQAFRQVIAIDPQAAVAHQQLGYACILTNNFGIAVQELETAESLEPNNATTYNALGLAYQAQGEVEHSIAMFEKALGCNPNDGDSAFNLGNLLASQGRYGQAQDAFQKAVHNNPRMPLAHNHLGTLLSLSGNYKQAMLEFQQAIALNPDLASAHYGLGLTLYNTKNYSACIPEFKRALVLNPALVDAHNKIEQAYRKAGLATTGLGVN